ncbi:MAG: inorganic phosphate transporter [Clostridia bacterium]|nr:inorganic phosphate transporter [Clostridia bacterium]
MPAYIDNKRRCSPLSLTITILLTLGVIFVNGWTDAPNAIATCVATKSMGLRPAIAMAALMNLLGALTMTALNPFVAFTIYNMVDFGTNTQNASVALCAALVAIVVWSIAAWAFGIPTSESHALIAGLTGAAVALHGNLSGVSGKAWRSVLIGMILSVVLAFLLGFLCARVVSPALPRPQFFRRAQIVGAAATAFMHGAQDGQKFMGVFLLGVHLASGTAASSSGVKGFPIPLWLTLLCATVMALGTAMGGKKIIDSVGSGITDLTPRTGFCADLGAALSLLTASLLGLPVSTTHAKVTAIIGVGAAEKPRRVNLRTAKEMVLAWVCTFPGCGLLGFGVAKVLMWVW